MKDVGPVILVIRHQTHQRQNSALMSETKRAGRHEKRAYVGSRPTFV